MKDNGFTHESHNAATVEWYTPPWIFEGLSTEFDLDVCSPAGGIPWLPAKKCISLPTDSLKEDWNGFVWCNPPYGKETAPFLQKMCYHNNGIALVFARTDTKWFHDYAGQASALLFIKGRVQFIDGNKMTKSTGSTCGSVLIGYGDKARDILANSKIDGMYIHMGE